MLIGKINPSVKFSEKNDLLQDPSIIEADRILVTAERMPLGADEVRFSFLLGKITEVEVGKLNFHTMHKAFLSFEKSELSDWGTDDSVMFYKVANKIGILIIEIEDLSISDVF